MPFEKKDDRFFKEAGRPGAIQFASKDYDFERARETNIHTDFGRTSC